MFNHVQRCSTMYDKNDFLTYGMPFAHSFNMCMGDTRLREIDRQDVGKYGAPFVACTLLLTEANFVQQKSLLSNKSHFCLTKVILSDKSNFVYDKITFVYDKITFVRQKLILSDKSNFVIDKITFV